MKLKKWLSLFDLRETLKDSELNRILDKLLDNLSLTYMEEKFLNRYDKINEDDLKDFTHLSVVLASNKIEHLLVKNKRVLCDLYDRNGKIGLYIISIDSERYILKLKGDEIVTLNDSCLYNILYLMEKDEYSLQLQDEYFEKIMVDNE